MSILKKQVFDRVCSIIKTNIDNTTQLSEATTREDLIMDSLDDVELLMFCEEEFDIDIKDEDWEKCWTIKDVVNLILTLDPKIKHDNFVEEVKLKDRHGTSWWKFW